MITTFQRAVHPDHFKPYPLHVNSDGTVCQQDFWRGYPSRLLGFQKDLAVPRIDLTWADASASAAFPDQTIGMYMVAIDSDDTIGVYPTAITHATLTELPDGAL